MKNVTVKFLILLSILLTGLIVGFLISHYNIHKKLLSNSFVQFDDTRNHSWDKDFLAVEITSSVDKAIQKAYYYRTESDFPKPLVVSLHTWSGDYSQKDDLAALCQQKDVNYIHPNFRGANKSVDACGSSLTTSDIDDAISFCIASGKVDTTQIYVIGVSGGGHATLLHFARSKHNIRKFSAWASISDLEAWHNESKIRGNQYAEDVFKCTGSENELNINEARARSPLYEQVSPSRLNTSKIEIYAGIYDGIQGSVPFTHSINFYNKLIEETGSDTLNQVSSDEKAKLLEFRRPLADFGKVSDRDICLQKKFNNAKLVIFEGNHEMLTEYAFSQLFK